MILTSPSDAMIAGEQDKDARIAELETALRPFAGRVYNDNGDMTINTAPLDSEDLVRAYFVLKRKL